MVEAFVAGIVKNALYSNEKGELSRKYRDKQIVEKSEKSGNGDSDGVEPRDGGFGSFKIGWADRRDAGQGNPGTAGLQATAREWPRAGDTERKEGRH